MTPERQTPCCDKCLGSYGFGKDNWGCIDKGCPCHEKNRLTNISEEELKELEESGAKITKIPRQEIQEWSEESHKVHGVLYELVSGELPDTQTALRKIDAIVEGFLATHTEKVRREGLEAELKKLYDSEINVDISCFWDGGWRVRLGDEMNGYKSPEWDSCELHEIVPAIRELASKHYPNSTYTKALLHSERGDNK